MISLQFDDIRPFYFLVRWQFYEKARYQLKDNELQDAKIFFNAMQHLSEEDKQILADVYYKSPNPTNFDTSRELYMTVKPVQDKDLCDQYGISVERFAGKRRRAQYYLKLEMQKVIQSIETVFMYRVNPFLYLIEYQKEKDGKTQFVLGDISQAKAFYKDEHDQNELYSFSQLGFTKVPVIPNKFI